MLKYIICDLCSENEISQKDYINGILHCEECARTKTCGSCGGVFNIKCSNIACNKIHFIRISEEDNICKACLDIITIQANKIYENKV